MSDFFEEKSPYFTPLKKFVSKTKIDPKERQQREDSRYIPFLTREDESIKLLIQNRDLFDDEELEQIDIDREFEIGRIN